MQEKIRKRQDHGNIDLLCFSVSPYRFCLPAVEIDNIMPLPRLTRLPFSDDDVAGIFTYFGEVVTCYDLRRKFSLPLRDADNPGQLLLGREGEALLAFWVDEVSDIVESQSLDWQLVPIPMSRNQVITGCYVDEQTIILETSIERLHRCDSTAFHGVAQIGLRSLQGETGDELTGKTAASVTVAPVTCDDLPAQIPAPVSATVSMDTPPVDASPDAGVAALKNSVTVSVSENGAEDDDAAQHSSTADAVAAVSVRSCEPVSRFDASKSDETASPAEPANTIGSTLAAESRSEGLETAETGDDAVVPPAHNDELTHGPNSLQTGAAAQLNTVSPVGEPYLVRKQKDHDCSADQVVATGPDVPQGFSMPTMSVGTSIGVSSDEPQRRRDSHVGSEAPSELLTTDRAVPVSGQETQAWTETVPEAADAVASVSVSDDLSRTNTVPTNGAGASVGGWVWGLVAMLVLLTVAFPLIDPQIDTGDTGVIKARSLSSIGETVSTHSSPGASPGALSAPDQAVVTDSLASKQGRVDNSSPVNDTVSRVAVASPRPSVVPSHDESTQATDLQEVLRIEDRDLVIRVERDMHAHPEVDASVSPPVTESLPSSSSTAMAIEDAGEQKQSLDADSGRSKPPARSLALASLTTAMPETSISAQQTPVVVPETSDYGSVMPGDYIQHNVVRGDTLWDIAKHYLGDPFRYPQLARLNRIKNPDLIYPGDLVTIERRNMPNERFMPVGLE